MTAWPPWVRLLSWWVGGLSSWVPRKFRPRLPPPSGHHSYPPSPLRLVLRCRSGASGRCLRVRGSARTFVPISPPSPSWGAALGFPRLTPQSGHRSPWRAQSHVGNKASFTELLVLWLQVNGRHRLLAALLPSITGVRRPGFYRRSAAGSLPSSPGVRKWRPPSAKSLVGTLSFH